MDRKVLGRGLSSLIPKTQVDQEEERVEKLPLNQIRPNPYQPREEFNASAIEELKKSIEEKGLVQPIIVRKRPDGYELIAGERRWRAAKELALDSIPAIVKSINDEDALQMSLIENIQRVDLNPIEEAKAYKFLIDKFNMGQDKIGEIVGKARSSVANILRLLNLPKEVQAAMKKGAITMGHGRILLEISDMHEQMKILREIISKSLSVRELENLTRRKIKVKLKKVKPIASSKRGLNPLVHALQEALQGFLGTKVRITQQRKRGKIEIEFYSLGDLERIIKLMKP